MSGPTTLGTNGTVAVNSGTLTFGATSTVTNASTFQISRGANLNVVANGLTLNAGQAVTGNGTVTGNVTLNSGGLLAPSSLAGSAANLVSPGTLTVVGNLSLNGGGQYNWALSSVLGGQYTQSVTNVTGTLDLSGLSSSNRFVIRPTSLLLSNSALGNVYDFDSTSGYSWTIFTSSGITGGFSSDKFEVSLVDFNNITNGGLFSIIEVNDTIVLNFTPVPEPMTVLALGVTGLAAVRWLRRQRITTASQKL